MRGPNRFRKGEVQRAIKAAEAAGLPVERVDVDPKTGVISVIVGKHEAGEATNEWDAQ
jgi:hypothetical protein